MRMLVVGGTVFVGRAVVAAAHARGHDVTVFHRGDHGEDVPGTHLHGDRQGNLGVLRRSGSWDAVVDTCGFSGPDVTAVAEALGDRVGHYTFVSSVSAYSDWPALPVTDASPVFDDDAPPGYGADKVRGERAALSAYGARALIARPALIVGPHENIGRLPYWLRRVARGGEVLAPGTPDDERQWVDARDLADWVVAMAERRQGGTHAVVSPRRHFTMGELLESCRAVTGSDATIRWAPGERITAAGIEPWRELPIWLWSADEPTAGTWSVDPAGAITAGFTARPMAETVADTWAWLASGGDASGYRREYAVRDLDPEREAAALR